MKLSVRSSLFCVSNWWWYVKLQKFRANQEKFASLNVSSNRRTIINKKLINEFNQGTCRLRNVCMPGYVMLHKVYVIIKSVMLCSGVFI